MKSFLGVSVFFGLVAQTLGQSYWYESITKQGKAPYNPQGTAYQVYRNVKDFGAKGDGVTDDTAAIMSAITSGSRCTMGPSASNCKSATNSPAIVYFPSGTYLISYSLRPSYMTMMIGNPNSLPIIKATAGFVQNTNGMIDSNPYDNQNSNEDYVPVNVFYRQIRNFVIDMTNIPATTGALGIHWPTAQATSLQNIVFKMSTVTGNQHQGLFIENGSGGFLTDLVFYGGMYGMNIGSQQFTSRNLTFYNSATAIHQIWDWSWTYSGVSINNCGIGLDISNYATAPNQNVGSVTFIDSTMSNTPIGVKTSHTLNNDSPTAGGSLGLENIILTNVPTAIQGPDSVHLAGTTGTMTITSWVEGHVYSPTGPTSTIGKMTAFPRAAGLLSGTNFYARSKPQYGSVALANIASVRTAGAKGDGVTDDTAALQAIITSAAAAGKVVFFDSGIYKITNILYIPPGSKIVGEAYPVILAAGSIWQDINNPAPVVRVGSVAGETGVIEWSDMIVSTQGAQPGATLIQYNLASPVTTPSGIWDVHTRVGGFLGSNLQVAQCAVSVAQPNAACYAAWMSMRITNIASGLYLENVWLWTADHDIDDASNTQISVYAGRGLSIESTIGNIWLIGTAVEHHILYQYQLSNTKNIMMGYIQTETPYMQPSPTAVTPFGMVAGRNDPDFASFCSGKTGTCAAAWGLRVLASTNVLIYGAGFYSFFNNYSTTCSNHDASVPVYNEYCQTQIFGIDEGGGATTYSGSSVYVYGLNTIGVVSMADRNGASVISQLDNTGNYQESVARFTTQ